MQALLTLYMNWGLLSGQTEFTLISSFEEHGRCSYRHSFAWVSIKLDSNDRASIKMKLRLYCLSAPRRNPQSTKIPGYTLNSSGARFTLTLLPKRLANSSFSELNFQAAPILITRLQCTHLRYIAQWINQDFDIWYFAKDLRALRRSFAPRKIEWPSCEAFKDMGLCLF